MISIADMPRWTNMRRAMSAPLGLGLLREGQRQVLERQPPGLAEEPVAQPAQDGAEAHRRAERDEGDEPEQRGDDDGADAAPDPLSQRHRHASGRAPSPRAAASRSHSSRTAPRPPGARATKWTAARTSGMASAGAAERPTRRSSGRSLTSSPM